MPSKTFEVPNISCGHCVMAVKNEVSELAGVTRVDASHEDKMVTVEWGDPATWEQVRARLVEINYPPGEAN